MVSLSSILQLCIQCIIMHACFFIPAVLIALCVAPRQAQQREVAPICKENTEPGRNSAKSICIVLKQNSYMDFASYFARSTFIDAHYEIHAVASSHSGVRP